MNRKKTERAEKNAQLEQGKKKVTIFGTYQGISYAYNWQYAIFILLAIMYVKKDFEKGVKIMMLMNTYALPIQFITTIINTIWYTLLIQSICK